MSASTPEQPDLDDVVLDGLDFEYQPDFDASSFDSPLVVEDPDELAFFSLEVDTPRQQVGSGLNLARYVAASGTIASEVNSLLENKLPDAAEARGNIEYIFGRGKEEVDKKTAEGQRKSRLFELNLLGFDTAVFTFMYRRNHLGGLSWGFEGLESYALSGRLASALELAKDQDRRLETVEALKDDPIRAETGQIFDEIKQISFEACDIKLKPGERLNLTPAQSEDVAAFQEGAMMAYFAIALPVDPRVPLGTQVDYSPSFERSPEPLSQEAILGLFTSDRSLSGDGENDLGIDIKQGISTAKWVGFEAELTFDELNPVYYIYDKLTDAEYNDPRVDAITGVYIDSNIAELMRNNFADGLASILSALAMSSSDVRNALLSMQEDILEEVIAPAYELAKAQSQARNSRLEVVEPYTVLSRLNDNFRREAPHAASPLDHISHAAFLHGGLAGLAVFAKYLSVANPDPRIGLLEQADNDPRSLTEADWQLVGSLVAEGAGAIALRGSQRAALVEKFGAPNAAKITNNEETVNDALSPGQAERARRKEQLQRVFELTKNAAVILLSICSNSKIRPQPPTQPSADTTPRQRTYISTYVPPKTRVAQASAR